MGRCLNQWRYSLLTLICLSLTDNRSSSVNTLKPRQDGRRFPALKFVPNGPINNIPVLVQIMAWRRAGDKPLSEPMMVRLPTHICVTRPQWGQINGCHWTGGVPLYEPVMILDTDAGIIESIKLRDNLYKKLKACTTDSPEYELNQYNLKIYNGYLRQCIRAAKKKQHYTHEFAKFKNDIRKTWDTLKDIMNKKKSKVAFPTYFLNNGKYVCGAKNIADKFNEYFTEIGPSLASENDVSNKSPFNTYLTSPCTSSFYFQYTIPSGILKIIQGLKPKTSVGYDHLSSKVLKDIADIASTPLSIIINQSLCSGIFPSKLKIAKVIPLFKKGDIQLFGNYRPVSSLSRKCSRKRHTASFMNIFHLMRFSMTVSTDFENITQPNLLRLN